MAAPSLPSLVSALDLCPHQLSSGPLAQALSWKGSETRGRWQKCKPSLAPFGAGDVRGWEMDQEALP